MGPGNLVNPRPISQNCPWYLECPMSSPHEAQRLQDTKNLRTSTREFAPYLRRLQDAPARSRTSHEETDRSKTSPRQSTSRHPHTSHLARQNSRISLFPSNHHPSRGELTPQDDVEKNPGTRLFHSAVSLKNKSLVEHIGTVKLTCCPSWDMKQ